MKVYSTFERKFLFSLRGHNNHVLSAAFAPDTRLIASGSDDRTVKLFDFSSRQVINTFCDHDAGINSVQFHPDGTCVASGA